MWSDNLLEAAVLTQHEKRKSDGYICGGTEQNGDVRAAAVHDVHVLFMSDSHHHPDVKSPVTRMEIITLIKV